MSDSDGDDVPRLSAHSLAALQEFYAETSVATAKDQFAVATVEEDWRMSQFWYNDETAARLAEEVIREAGEGGRIACVCAPSVYQKLKQGVVEGWDRVSAVVLEFDRRFATYGDDFIFYDYNEPLSLGGSVAPQSFDVVLADPPYLSKECLEKVAKTIKYLSKGKVLLCTGAIMENVAEELLGVKKCSFLPEHKRNLSNEFRCFVNYPSQLLSC
ncbi:EEF1A lysine methyltransferase 1 [Takifugu rubripes]|uniref:EEF1A lysine methyltransferase 1 n=2 Tax=Takifugu TaxID=31032 RepID=H2UU60_TAKRU|nr:EEF1A lysine methyltransferase 1 [Takifugu rubripes]XP_011611767.1 EEF1A lysine methyltransferase 1 [Takifugu rubripes]XP_011611774.1 EEF1A lysine methyltransferase 1 [Takifugu rubripes]XP_011611783.1 EEF1A lysine methyltransferase 1 [Takifugu rubripes]XP_056895332.1 EEF1A lysine methyltransferase 1 [Takifugu flavidus]XP_056895339.1 EEF1A lysine methyltransferase 1 [Takifugu flavidus]XP_056895349.1 EEF1A lysine methyltransferase 1 [Takifugu flavidus]XP_056895360.1 EEF1A lysine methyltrans|eukprot:XP_003962281.1 PREDICTED: N(6)-adenine-specific DNA methyltransferase 2 [Takifugu rubripes]